jgi:putative ABC transport system permease protein
VSAAMFSLLGWQPILGRTFTDDEERRAAPVVVLAEPLWRRRFAGDSALVGRTIPLNGVATVVVGIRGRGFSGARPGLTQTPLLWTPMGTAPQSASLIVRLGDGVQPLVATQWLARTLADRVPNVARTDSVAATPELVPLRDIAIGDVERPLLLLLGGVAFLVLLVTVNVATLQLAKGAAREREFAIRAALGASRLRQVRHVMLESGLLAAAAGAAGTLIAIAGTSVLKALGGGIIPRLSTVTIDWRVLLFATSVTGGCALVSGLVPAWLAAKPNLASGLTGSARLDRGSAHRWGGIRGALVVTEIALAVVLFVGAGLMIKGFLRVMPAEPGFSVADRTRVPVRLAAGVTGSTHRVYDDSVHGAERRIVFANAVRERMQQIPGVRDVAITSFVPLVRESAVSEVRPGGATASTGSTALTAHHRAVSANYFDVMEMRVLGGRAFDVRDHAGAPRTVIINETAAQRWWPAGQALGRTVTFTEGSRAHAVAEVVGIVSDVRFSGHDTRARPELYVPLEQAPPRVMNFIAHTVAESPSLVAPLRRAVWAVDPRLAIDDVEPMDVVVQSSVAVPRFYASVMGAFALVALVLASAGIHSILAYAVSRRSREIGIRMALGAQRPRVVGLIVRQGMTLTLAGIVAGVLASMALTRFLQAMLFEVRPNDPVVFGASVGLLVVVALAACVAPATRAVRIDPLLTVRGE